MPIAFRRDSNVVKPPIGASLNTGHPLAANLAGAWLLNEGAGPNCRSLVVPSDVLVLQGAASWQNQYGSTPTSAGQSGAAGSGMRLSSPSSALQATQVVSVFWYGICANVPADQDVSNNPSFVSMSANNNATSPFVAYGIHRPNADNTGIAFFDDAGGTFNSHTVTALLTANYVPISTGMTFRNGGNLNGYFNGRNVYTVARSSALTYGTGPRIYTNWDGDASNNAGNANTAPLVIYIWAQELSATEMLWLNSDPYALVNWNTPRTKVYARGFTPVAPFVPWSDQQLAQLLPQ
jgi:hypothetical protein